jgi:hypothetical protein
MKFKDYYEMASFTLPRKIHIKDADVNAIDMQFELGRPTVNKYGKVMNQGSKFLAKIPDSEMYLTYDPDSGANFINTNDVEYFLQNGYEEIPDDWWKKARFI